MLFLIFTTHYISYIRIKHHIKKLILGHEEDEPQETSEKSLRPSPFRFLMARNRIYEPTPQATQNTSADVVVGNKNSVGISDETIVQMEEGKTVDGFKSSLKSGGGDYETIEMSDEVLPSEDNMLPASANGCENDERSNKITEVGNDPVDISAVQLVFKTY